MTDPEARPGVRMADLPVSRDTIHAELGTA
jgi:hypothetical protein